MFPETNKVESSGVWDYKREYVVPMGCPVRIFEADIQEKWF